jgi:tetratricopeptide (TPR) repeat protein
MKTESVRGLLIIVLLCTLGCLSQYSHPNIALIKENAQLGETEAQTELGITYEKKGNYTVAVKWYRKAAEQGHPRAQALLAGKYALGKGVKEDHLTACAWAIISSDNGSEHGEKVKTLISQRFGPEFVLQAQALVRKMIRKNPRLITTIGP